MLSGQDPDTMCRPSGSAMLRMTPKHVFCENDDMGRHFCAKRNEMTFGLEMTPYCFYLELVSKLAKVLDVFFIKLLIFY